MEAFDAYTIFPEPTINIPIPTLHVLNNNVLAEYVKSYYPRGTDNKNILSYLRHKRMEQRDLLLQLIRNQ